MSIGRASVMIGAGTLLSRATGLLRSIVLVTALGAISQSADAFTVANGLPNSIYMIVSTGILTAVIVPQIVKASRAADGGSAFISKLFTLGTVILLVVTTAAVVCAPLLVRMYALSYEQDQFDLAVAFAYWCLPQIFFYGLYALVGETLNARGIFGPFTWAPIANNIISIAGFVAFMAMFGTARTDVDWTSGMIALVGGSATLGIVVQAGLLLAYWPRTRLALKPDFRWRGMGLGDIGRLAGWTFLMVLVTQAAALVQTQVFSTASGLGAANIVAANAGLIFILPYSIIVLSIGTPYFTRLSGHAHDGRDDDVRSDVSASIRSTTLLIGLSLAALVAAAFPVSRIFTDARESAVPAGIVLFAYLIGLLPLAVLFTVQRTFYAYNDTRTPFFFTLAQAAVAAAGAGLALFAPVEVRAAAVALGQSFSLIVQVILATWLLHRRLGSLGVRRWLVSITRYLVAAIPAGAAGYAVFALAGGIDGWMLDDKWWGLAGTALIGVVVSLVYFGVLVLLRTPELRPVGAQLRRLLPGGRG